VTPFSYIGPSVCSSKKKSKKKGRTLAFERVKLPTLGKKCLLFPERRRWLLLLRWRRKKKCEVDDDKEKSKKKNGKKLARASQNSPVYSNPFVRSFPTASFHSSCLPIFTFPRQREKANDEWKELPPFHPLSSIDRSIDDSCMCVTFSRAWAAHAQKMMFYVRARAREKVKKIVWDV